MSSHSPATRAPKALLLRPARGVLNRLPHEGIDVADSAIAVQEVGVT